MTGISIMGWIGGQMEVVEVDSEFIEGCVGLHRPFGGGDYFVLTHIPTGRAIVGFSADTPTETLRLAAQEFDALLKDKDIAPSWDNCPLLPRKSPLVKACLKVILKYDECLLLAFNGPRGQCP